MHTRTSPRKSPRTRSRTSPKKEIKVHDNGGRPFEVKITPTEIQVFVNQDGKYKYFKTWKNYLHIWIGEDECNKKFSYGNSVLVQLTKNKYLFIGMEIVSFTFTNKIKEFFSPIGNNDVPYPWFSDVDNHVYMLTTPSNIEYFMVSESKIKTFGNCASSSLCDRKKCKKSDPYVEIWGKKSVPKVSVLSSKVIHPRV